MITSCVCVCVPVCVCVFVLLCVGVGLHVCMCLCIIKQVNYTVLTENALCNRLSLPRTLTHSYRDSLIDTIKQKTQDYYRRKGFQTAFPFLFIIMKG